MKTVDLFFLNLFAKVQSARTVDLFFLNLFAKVQSARIHYRRRHGGGGGGDRAPNAIF